MGVMMMVMMMILGDRKIGKLRYSHQEVSVSWGDLWKPKVR